MATQKELLNAMKVIKEYCELHRANAIRQNVPVCGTCMLRNSYGGCGLLGESDDRPHGYVADWDFVEPEYPKLFTY